MPSCPFCACSQVTLTAAGFPAEVVQALGKLLASSTNLSSTSQLPLTVNHILAELCSAELLSLGSTLDEDISELSKLRAQMARTQARPALEAATAASALAAAAAAATATTSGEVWRLEQPVGSRLAPSQPVLVIAAGGDVAMAEGSEASMASGIIHSSAGVDAGGICSSNGSSGSSHDESPTSLVLAVTLSSYPTVSPTMAAPAESGAAAPQALVTDAHSSSETPHGNEAGGNGASKGSVSQVGDSGVALELDYSVGEAEGEGEEEELQEFAERRTTILLYRISKKALLTRVLGDLVARH